MEENDKPKQTNFDMACDVFYEEVSDSEIKLSEEQMNEIITPALVKFRDELRDQMGNDKYYSTYKDKD